MKGKDSQRMIICGTVLDASYCN